MSGEVFFRSYQRIPMHFWGEDHWKVLLYVGDVGIRCHGFEIGSDPIMRQNRCSELVLSNCPSPERPKEKSRMLWKLAEMRTTQLIRGAKTIDHDDWNCLEDLIEYGLVRAELGLSPATKVFMSETGDYLVAQLKAFDRQYGSLKDFVPFSLQSFDVKIEVGHPKIAYFGFDSAMTRLKIGRLLRRKEWLDKDLFVVKQKGYPEGIGVNSNTAEAMGIPLGQIEKFAPYLLVGKVGMLFAPWVPSQIDMFAEDWHEYSKREGKKS